LSSAHIILCLADGDCIAYVSNIHIADVGVGVGVSSDASFVTLQLDLYPGCVVVESGTGSGNMTVNFARAISPNGHVHTFEYNADRVSKAVAEFEKLGLAPLVTVKHGDVCGSPTPEVVSEAITETATAAASTTSSGIVYGFDGVGDSTVDAVFLDVPAPWLAVGHAKRVLKAGRSVCTYSPCVEQVSKTRQDKTR
jgi:tRNA (adenine57-N1/adenine58-N1)-methyltransferase catalytic subunit